MAHGAYTSPYHFSRMLSRSTGEAPVLMRRRVMLERAAWRLREGVSVTEVAWEAGYESLEGFSRAFTRAYGHPPSRAAAQGERSSIWLPAANGIHFHPPMHLWVHAEEQAMNPVTEQLVRHDLDDTRALIEQAKGLPDDAWRAVRLPGHTVLSWDGPEESLAAVLLRQVYAKETWLASIEGYDTPSHDPDLTPAQLLDRHETVAPRWLAAVRDIDRRGAWNDRLVDALCDPPESFVLSSVLAHVLTYAAHRRLLARALLRAAGVETDQGDPIMWLRAEMGETR